MTNIIGETIISQQVNKRYGDLMPDQHGASPIDQERLKSWIDNTFYIGNGLGLKQPPKVYGGGSSSNDNGSSNINTINALINTIMCIKQIKYTNMDLYCYIIDICYQLLAIIKIVRINNKIEPTHWKIDNNFVNTICKIVNNNPYPKHHNITLSPYRAAKLIQEDLPNIDNYTKQVLITSLDIFIQFKVADLIMKRNNIKNDNKIKLEFPLNLSELDKYTIFNFITYIVLVESIGS